MEGRIVKALSSEGRGRGEGSRSRWQLVGVVLEAIYWAGRSRDIWEFWRLDPRLHWWGRPRGPICPTGRIIFLGRERTLLFSLKSKIWEVGLIPMCRPPMKLYLYLQLAKSIFWRGHRLPLSYLTLRGSARSRLLLLGRKLDRLKQKFIRWIKNLGVLTGC